MEEKKKIILLKLFLTQKFYAKLSFLLNPIKSEDYVNAK